MEKQDAKPNLRPPSQVGALIYGISLTFFMGSTAGCLVISEGSPLQLRIDEVETYHLTVTPRIDWNDLDRQTYIADASVPMADIEIRTLDISSAAGTLTCKYSNEPTFYPCPDSSKFVWLPSDYVTARAVNFRLEDPSGEKATINFTFDPSSYYSSVPGLAGGLEFVTCNTIVNTNTTLPLRTSVDTALATTSQVVCFVGGGELVLDSGFWGSTPFSGLASNVTLISPRDNPVTIRSTTPQQVLSTGAGASGSRIIGLRMIADLDMAIYLTSPNIMFQGVYISSSAGYNIGCGGSNSYTLYGSRVDAKGGQVGLNIAQSCAVTVIKSYVSSDSERAIHHYSDADLNILNSVISGGDASSPSIDVNPGASVDVDINISNSTLAVRSSAALLYLSPAMGVGYQLSVNLNGVNFVRRGTGSPSVAGVEVNSADVLLNGAAGTSWFCHENASADFSALLLETVTLAGGSYVLANQNNANPAQSDPCGTDVLSLF